MKAEILQVQYIRLWTNYHLSIYESEKCLCFKNSELATYAGKQFGYLYNKILSL